MTIATLIPVVNVQMFGAINDGTTDCVAAVLAAIAALPSTGGIVYFPQGSYRWASTVTINKPNIVFVGTGKRNPQTVLTTRTSTNPTTIYVDHTGSAITLPHTSNINGFVARDMTFMSRTSSPSARCFGFDLAGAGSFARDFLLERITIQGFTVAIELIESSAGSGSSNSMGMLRVRDCSIMHNVWIAKTGTSSLAAALQWNEFIFEGCDAGSNGNLSNGGGGISIAAQNPWICGNILEGQANPIVIAAGYRAITIKGNYFEQNVGFACIRLNNCAGPFDIGPNSYLSVTSTHKVYLFSTGPGNIVDPYWSDSATKVQYPALASQSTERNINTAATQSGSQGTNNNFIRSDVPSGAYTQYPPMATALVRATASVNAGLRNPIDGRRAYGISSDTTSATGFTHTAVISATTGQWVIACWALRRTSASSADPNIQLYGDALTNWSNNANRYNEIVGTGEWMLVTAAYRVPSNITGFTCILNPYGAAPSAGLGYEMFPPVIYVVADLNNNRPYFDVPGVLSGTAAPTTGTWSKGDMVTNSDPDAGEASGWVCTVAGTPGTWKELAPVSL